MVEAFTELGRPAVVPVGILSETAYMLEARAPGSMDRLLASVVDGSLLLDCGDTDPPRVRELMARYADLPLGFADASVIVCAERYGGLVLTLDRRDFGVVARELPITLLP